MKIANSNILFLFFALAGGLLRYLVAIDNPSDDLNYYLADNVGTQVTRFGLAKSILFYPFTLIAEFEVRIAVLAFLMSILNTFAIRAAMVGNEKTEPLYKMVSFLLAVFFFQIDMHLVRQQVALYLFIIFLFSKGSFRYVSLMLSVLYHEVIAIFVFCLLASSFIQRYWTKTGRTDLLFAIPLALVIGLDAGDISAGLLLVLLIFAFFLFRFDSSPRILISVLLIFGIVADFSGLLSPINGERYLGVVVAFYMFTFVFISQLGRRQVLLRSVAKLSILLGYSLYYAASI